MLNVQNVGFGLILKNNVQSIENSTRRILSLLNDFVQETDSIFKQTSHEFRNLIRLLKEKDDEELTESERKSIERLCKVIEDFYHWMEYLSFENYSTLREFSKYRYLEIENFQNV